MGADDETAEVIGNVAGVAAGGKALSVTAPVKLTFLQKLRKLMRDAALNPAKNRA